MIGRSAWENCSRETTNYASIVLFCTVTQHAFLGYKMDLYNR